MPEDKVEIETELLASRQDEAVQTLVPAIATAERAERYLSLVAGAADRLLAAEDPTTMVEEIFDLVRNELKLDVFVNFRLLTPDLLELEAYGGLTAEEVEPVATLVMGEAVCGCVARDRTPFHATAIQQSDDPQVQFVKSLGLDTYACTPLMHGDELLGTLSFGRRWCDHFEEHELRLMRTLCHYVALAKFRLRMDRALRDEIEMRERLLQELNHRVRNSMQIVIGLLDVEQAAVEQDEVRDCLSRLGDRIQVVAAVHQRLYLDEGSRDMDVACLLQALASSPSGGGRTPATFQAEGASFLPVEKAVALALVFTELLNATLANGVTTPVIALKRLQDELTIRFSNIHPGTITALHSDASRSKLLRILNRQLRADLDWSAEKDEIAMTVPLGARAS